MKLSVNTYLSIMGIKFTIKKKYGRWHISFRHNGKPINRSTRMEATKDNLTIVKKEILPQIAQELISAVQTTNTTDEAILDNFAEAYFLLHQEHVREHVSARDYSNFRRHILPYFKGRKLSSIKPMELEAWQKRLLSKYKPSSVQKYRSIFHGIFTSAYHNELISKNPFNTVTAPKMKKKFNSINENETINPFTQKEIDALIYNEDTTYLSNFIKLMANTGMRPGEVISLTWDDIDLTNRSININKTTVNGKIGLPKTLSSVRVIDMIQGAYEALKAQYSITGNDKFVFTNSRKQQFYSHDVINLNLRRRLQCHELEVRPLYQLRHSFASRMIKSGIDITWVSSTLEHKDSSITLQVYTKFIQEDNQTRMTNINKIDQQLGKGK